MLSSSPGITNVLLTSLDLLAAVISSIVSRRECVQRGDQGERVGGGGGADCVEIRIFFLLLKLHFTVDRIATRCH